MHFTPESLDTVEKRNFRSDKRCVAHCKHSQESLLYFTTNGWQSWNDLLWQSNVNQTDFMTHFSKHFKSGFFFLVVLGFWSLTSIINSNALWWNYPNTMESNVCPVCSLFWFCVPLNSECWYQILLHWTKITFTLIPALSILCNVRPVEQRRVNSCVYFSQDKLKQNHKATK